MARWSRRSLIEEGPIEPGGVGQGLGPKDGADADPQGPPGAGEKGWDRGIILGTLHEDHTERSSEAQLRERGVPNALSKGFFSGEIEPLNLRDTGLATDWDGVQVKDSGQIEHASLERMERLNVQVQEGRLGGFAVVTGRHLGQLGPFPLGRIDAVGGSGHQVWLAGESGPSETPEFRDAHEAFTKLNRELLSDPQLVGLLLSAHPNPDSLRLPPADPETIGRLTEREIDGYFWDLVRDRGVEDGVFLDKADPEHHERIMEIVGAGAGRYGLVPSRRGDLVIMEHPALKPDKGIALNRWAEARGLTAVLMPDDADAQLGRYPAREFLNGQGNLLKIAVIGPRSKERPGMVQARDLAGYLNGLPEVAKFMQRFAETVEGRAG